MKRQESKALFRLAWRRVRHRRSPRALRMKPLGEISPKRHKSDKAGRVREYTKASRPAKLAHRSSRPINQQSPDQRACGKARRRSPIACRLKITLKLQRLRHVMAQATRRRPFHRGLAFCRRASTSSWALAASTSRTASWNLRPASTRRRTSSTQSLGMCWTCFLPRTMKIRDQTGWRGPSAQGQVGLPQRRWKGRASREANPRQDGAAARVQTCVAGVEKLAALWVRCLSYGIRTIRTPQKQACFCQSDLAHFDHFIWPTLSC
jgi:hypothetical protein